MKYDRAASRKSSNLDRWRYFELLYILREIGYILVVEL